MDPTRIGLLSGDVGGVEGDPTVHMTLNPGQGDLSQRKAHTTPSNNDHHAALDILLTQRMKRHFPEDPQSERETRAVHWNAGRQYPEEAEGPTAAPALGPDFSLSVMAPVAVEVGSADAVYESESGIELTQK
eukprot:689575-Pelagomonas_calceolata.AAC.9